MNAPIALRSTTWRVRGHPLHFVEAGEGPPVLLVHGLIASTHAFKALIQHAGSRYRFIALDLPSSGKSGPYTAYSPRTLAEDCAALLDRLKVGPALVVGHSYGGVVAVELAARHPKAVKGLLAVSAPALGLGSFRRLLGLGVTERLWGAMGRLSRNATLIRSYLKLIWGTSSKLTAEHVSDYLEAMSPAGSTDATLEALRALSEYKLPVEALPDFKAPRRVLWGEQDRLVPVLHGEHLARALKASFTVLPKVGHFVPEEDPEAVERELDALSPRPRRKARVGQRRAAES